MVVELLEGCIFIVDEKVERVIFLGKNIYEIKEGS